MKNQNETSTPTPAKQKHRAFKIWIPTLGLLLLALFLIFWDNQSTSQKEPLIPTPIAKSLNPLEALLYSQLPELVSSAGHSGWVLDELEFNADNTQALLWMAESDLEDDDVVAREPDIVLALWQAESQSWQLHQPSDEDFAQIFLNSDFKDGEFAQRIFPDADPKAGPSGPTYGGYKLPWRAGQTKRITWSVAHSSCTPQSYCTYAYDFADGTMFDVVAAKGGFVYHWKDTCANGNSKCTNSFTIEDRTTTPWTYQIYLHLAQNSIPAGLRQEGVYVQQGQFIGKADDTGVSTGHHLHFMVVEQSTLDKCSFYCFGKAVDVTFTDVKINFDSKTQGGRPRLESEARWYGGQGQREYTSNNVLAGASLPAATLPPTATALPEPTAEPPAELPNKFYLFPIFKNSR